MKIGGCLELGVFRGRESNCLMGMRFILVGVCIHCNNIIESLCGLNNRILITILGAGSPRSRGQQGWFLVRAIPLRCRLCLLTTIFP